MTAEEKENILVIQISVKQCVYILIRYMTVAGIKDCLENVRVYLTSCGQDIVDRAINVKCTKAEVIWVFTDIEAVPFNRGFYSVDLKYFFKVTLAVFTGVGRPTEVEGLATFDEKSYTFRFGR